MMDRDPGSRWSMQDAAHRLHQLAREHSPENTRASTVSIGSQPAAAPLAAEPRASEPRASEPRAAESRAAESRTARSAPAATAGTRPTTSRPRLPRVGGSPPRRRARIDGAPGGAGCTPRCWRSCSSSSSAGSRTRSLTRVRPGPARPAGRRVRAAPPGRRRVESPLAVPVLLVLLVLPVHRPSSPSRSGSASEHAVRRSAGGGTGPAAPRPPSCALLRLGSGRHRRRAGPGSAPASRRRVGASYDGFWREISSVDVSSVRPVAGSDAVDVTLTYRSTDGRTSTERKRFDLIRSSSGGYLINGEHPIG